MRTGTGKDRMKEYVLLMILALAGCSDLGTDLTGPAMTIPRNTSVAQAKLLIVGQWEWVKSVGDSFSSQHVRTPASEGHTRQLRFSQDGTVGIYRDHVLVNTVSFDIVEEDVTGIYLTLIMDGFREYLFGVDSRLMGYDSRMVDGSAELYIRSW
jgi:hypothetical protein